MSANFNILKNFASEYHENNSIKEIVYEDGLVGEIQKTIDKLLDEKFYPSIQFQTILNKRNDNS